jgi:methionine-rich copper-binding protein CopC
MKKSIFIFALATLFFITGCGDDTPVQYGETPTDGRVIGQIHGIVMDNSNGKRAEDVLVKLVRNGKSVTSKTDSLGYYSFKDLISGEYVITATSGSNFARVYATVVIPDIMTVAGPNPTTKNYNYSVAENITLYPLNAGLSGVVYRQSVSGELVKAANVKVVAKLNYPIEPSIFDAVSNSDGVFTFDKNLPAAPQIDVYTHPYTADGQNYDLAFRSNIDLIPEVVVNMGNIVTEMATDEVILLKSVDNAINFSVTSNLEFLFSKAIDEDLTTISLENTNSNDLLDFDATWNSQKTSLTIDPYLTLKKDVTYKVVIRGEAVDQTAFSFDDITFTTEAAEQINLVSTNIQEVDGEQVTDFGVNDNIIFNFSKPVDQNSISTRITNLSSNNTLDCAVSLTSSNSQLVINPYLTLNRGTQYKAQVWGETQDGISFYYDITFSTVPSDAVEQLKITSTNIQTTDGVELEGFSTANNIQVTFNLQLDESKSSFTLRRDFSDISTVVVYTGTTVTVSASLEKNRTYDLIIGAEAYNGSRVDRSIRFHTETN